MVYNVRMTNEDNNNKPKNIITTLDGPIQAQSPYFMLETLLKEDNFLCHGNHLETQLLPNGELGFASTIHFGHGELKKAKVDGKEVEVLVSNEKVVDNACSYLRDLLRTHPDFSDKKDLKNDVYAHKINDTHTLHLRYPVAKILDDIISAADKNASKSI